MLAYRLNAIGFLAAVIGWHLVAHCPGSASTEKIGPAAIVFKNDGSGGRSTTAGVSRTTTVYGFLDFTTTIDDTVVVFRPSSASSSAMDDDDGGDRGSTSAASTATPAVRIGATETRRAHGSTATVDRRPAGVDRRKSSSDDQLPQQQRAIRTRLAGPAIVTLGRNDDDNDQVTIRTAKVIAPTPTLRGKSTTKSSSSSSSRSGTSASSAGRNGLVNSASIAEKRRRFLALARRNRPTVPTPTKQSDGDSDGRDESPTTITIADRRRSTNHPDSDQEMAESIERTPSKVKRTYQAIAPNGNGNGNGNQSSTGSGSGSGRILIRKFQRRVGPGGGSSTSSRANQDAESRRVLALRISNAKLNSLTGSTSGIEDDGDGDGDGDGDDDDDLDERQEERYQRRAFLIRNGPQGALIELASSLDDSMISTSATAKADKALSSSKSSPSLKAPPVGSDVTDYHEKYQDVTEYLGTEPRSTMVAAALMLESSLIDPAGHESSTTSSIETVALTSSSSSPSSSPKVEGDVDEDDVTSSTKVKRARSGPTVPLQLSIVTSSFSTTETRLRTSLLPVYDGKSTTYYTLTHSFVVAKTVSTFRTVPPEEYMHFLMPGGGGGGKNDGDGHGADDTSKGDDDSDADTTGNDVLPDESTDVPPPPLVLQRKVDLDDNDGKAPSDAELAENSSDELLERSGTSIREDTKGGGEDKDKDMDESPDKNNLMQQQQQQQAGLLQQQQQQHGAGGVNPALLGNLPFLNLLGPAAALGLNPYFPYGLGIPQVVTTSRPVLSTDVIYTSKTVPIIDGLTTSYHTLREAASTVTHTSYETYVTTTGGGGSPLAGGVGGGGGPPGFPGAGSGGAGMSIITQPTTFVTTETQVETQVFKLMYDGYKTSYRTVSSSQLVTRTVTTHTTSAVPIYNTLQLPYFG